MAADTAEQQRDRAAAPCLGRAEIAQLGAAAFLWQRVARQPHVLEWPSAALGATMLRRGFPFAVAGLVVNLQERLAPLMLGRFGHR